MSADPVDMTVPGRIEEARRMALASTPPEKWCQCRSSDIADLSEPSDMLWTVMAADESVCAVTGNGPTSKANANLYFHARAIILGLLDEIDRLSTILRVERERDPASWLVVIHRAEERCGAGTPDEARAVRDRIQRQLDALDPDAAIAEAERRMVEAHDRRVRLLRIAALRGKHPLLGEIDAAVRRAEGVETAAYDAWLALVEARGAKGGGA